MERELCEAGQKEGLKAQSLGGPLASLFCLVHVMNPPPQQHRLSASKMLTVGCILVWHSVTLQYSRRMLFMARLIQRLGS